MTRICVSKLTGSVNGLLPSRRQAIIWTNAGILLTGPLGTNFNETSSEIHTFSFKKIHLKLSPGKWRTCCLGLNVLNLCSSVRSMYRRQIAYQVLITIWKAGTTRVDYPQLKMFVWQSGCRRWQVYTIMHGWVRWPTYPGNTSKGSKVALWEFMLRIDAYDYNLQVVTGFAGPLSSLVNICFRYMP